MSELEEDSGIGEITQTQDEAALEGEERPLQPQEPQEAQEPEEPQAYEGTYQHGRYHGKGKLRHSDSTYYEGTFANGLFHGEGRLYVKGTPNLMHYLHAFIIAIRSPSTAICQIFQLYGLLYGPVIGYYCQLI